MNILNIPINSFVSPDKIGQEKIRKCFKKGLNVLRKDGYSIDIKFFKKVLIDCATPR